MTKKRQLRLRRHKTRGGLLTNAAKRPYLQRLSSVGKTFTDSFGKMYGATQSVGNMSWDATRRATQGTYDATKNYLRNKIKFSIFVKSYGYYGQVADGYLDVTKSLTFKDFVFSLEIDPTCIDKIEVDENEVDTSAQITKNFRLYVDLEKQPFYARDVALKLMVESMMKKGNMSFANKLTRKAFAAAVAAPVAVGSASIGAVATLGTAAASSALAIAFTGVKILKHGGIAMTAPALEFVRQSIPITWRENAYWGMTQAGKGLLTLAALTAVTSVVAVGAAASIALAGLQLACNVAGVSLEFGLLILEFLKSGGGIRPVTQPDGSEKYFFSGGAPEILQRMQSQATDTRLLTPIFIFMRMDPRELSMLPAAAPAPQNRGLLPQTNPRRLKTQRVAVAAAPGAAADAPLAAPLAAPLPGASSNVSDASQDPFPSFVQPSSAAPLPGASSNARPPSGDFELKTFKSNEPEVGDFDPVDNRESALEKLSTSGYSADELNYVGLQGDCNNFAQCKEKADNFRRTLIAHLTSTASKVPRDVATEVVNRGCGGYRRCAAAARDALTQRASQGSTRSLKPLFPENTVPSAVGARGEVQVPKGLFDDL